MKTLRVTVWLLSGLSVTVAIGLWCYDFGPFRASWIEFGYYGKFNQVQRVINGIPELTIVDYWQNHEFIMEDFGFTVRRKDGTTIQINFYENSEPMKLSRDEDIRDYVVRTTNSS